jgi:hypothetical protein
MDGQRKKDLKDSVDLKVNSKDLTLIEIIKATLPFIIIGAAMTYFSITYKPSERETGIYKEPPAVSYFTSLKPNRVRGTSFGEVSVQTDIDKDGLTDVEEIYSYMAPQKPVEVNVKEGYLKYLQYDLEKITELQKTDSLKIRSKEYFEGMH